MKGFTLIEVLVYCALFALIIGSALTAVYELDAGRESTELGGAVEADVLFVSQKIAWAVHGPASISISQDGTTLTVSRSDLPQETPFVFSVQNDAFVFSEKGNVPAPLTAAGLLVSGVQFSLSTNAPRYLSVSFQVNGTPESFVIDLYD